MSRADEIAQGLREESGCLTFPLNVPEYNQGHEDYKSGTPPPPMSSDSYDLGRNRAREAAERDAEFWAWQRRQDVEREARMREVLKDHPEALAEYLAKIAVIRNPKDQP